MVSEILPREFAVPETILEAGMTHNTNQSDGGNATAGTLILAKEKLHLPNQYDATRQLYEALEASTLVPFIEQKLQVLTSI